MVVPTLFGGLDAGADFGACSEAPEAKSKEGGTLLRPDLTCPRAPEHKSALGLS